MHLVSSLNVENNGSNIDYMRLQISEKSFVRVFAELDTK